MKKENQEMKNKLLQLISERFVPTSELVKKLNCTILKIQNLINNMVDYPIAECYQNGETHYKLMNKGDYE